MVSAQPGKAAQEMEKWAEQLQQRSARYTELHQRMSGLSETETSADGTVRVSVDGNGLPTELTVTDRGRGADPAKLSAALMACLAAAQAKLRARVEEVTRETVGEDGPGEAILAQYRERFPDPPENEFAKRPRRDNTLAEQEWDD